MLRMTNGKATMAWAMAGNNKEVRRFNGGSSRAMMNPNPRVTADVDNGSIKTGSKNPVSRFLRPARKAAEHQPRIKAIAVAARANPSELAMAVIGATYKMDWALFSNNAR